MTNYESPDSSVPDKMLDAELAVLRDRVREEFNSVPPLRFAARGRLAEAKTPLQRLRLPVRAGALASICALAVLAVTLHKARGPEREVILATPPTEAFRESPIAAPGAVPGARVRPNLNPVEYANLGVPQKQANVCFGATGVPTTMPVSTTSNAARNRWVCELVNLNDVQSVFPGIEKFEYADGFSFAGEGPILSGRWAQFPDAPTTGYFEEFEVFVGRVTKGNKVNVTNFLAMGAKARSVKSVPVGLEGRMWTVQAASQETHIRFRTKDFYVSVVARPTSAAVMNAKQADAMVSIAASIAQKLATNPAARNPRT